MTECLEERSKFWFFGYTHVPDGHAQNDLPQCCCTLSDIKTELMRQVGVYRDRTEDGSLEGIYFVNETKFEEELKILRGSFCSIFQACVQADAKVVSTNQSSEMEWRGDHDRFFFDFFLHPIYPNLNRNDSIRALQMIMNASRTLLIMIQS